MNRSLPSPTEYAISAGHISWLIEQAQKASGIAAKRFAVDALARGLLWSDPGCVREHDREMALRLGVDTSTVAVSEAPLLPHAVPVPLVVDNGAVVVRQFYVTFDPVGIHQDDALFDSGAKRAIEHALEAAAQLVSPPRAGRYRFAAVRPMALSNARIQGDSIGAAAFVSAVSLWSERAVRTGFAVTGSLVEQRLDAVGQIAAKIDGIGAHATYHALCIPQANRGELVQAAPSDVDVFPVATSHQLLSAVLETQRSVSSLAQGVSDARAVFATGWRGFRWPSVEEHLQRVTGRLPEGRLDLRVEFLSRLGATRRHLGDPLGGLRYLDQAEALQRSEWGCRSVPDSAIAYLLQQRAMTCRQLGDFTTAARSAREAVKVAERARLIEALIKALGCLGLVAMSRGRVHEAVDAFSRALTMQIQYSPGSTARSQAYLLEALMAAGDAKSARLHFRQAMDEVQGMRHRQERQARASWVRTAWGGALCRAGEYREAYAVLDDPAIHASLEEEAMPGLRARRYVGIVHARSGYPERAFEILAASPVVYGLALAPHLRFLAHLNVLVELRERVLAKRWTRDMAVRAQVALMHLPAHGRTQQMLEAPRRDIQAALRAERPPPVAKLSRLIERCSRLQ